MRVTLILLSVIYSSGICAQAPDPKKVYEAVNQSAYENFKLRQNAKVLSEQAKMAKSLKEIRDAGYELGTNKQLVKLKESQVADKRESNNFSHSALSEPENTLVDMMPDLEKTTSESVVTSLEEPESIPELVSINNRTAEFKKNGALVKRKEGGVLGNFKVTKIAQDTVFVTNGDESYELTVNFE